MKSLLPPTKSQEDEHALLAELVGASSLDDAIPKVRHELNAVIKNDIDFVLLQRKPDGYRSTHCCKPAAEGGNQPIVC